MRHISFNETFDSLIDQTRDVNPDILEPLLDLVWDFIRSPLGADCDDKATCLIALSDAIQETLARGSSTGGSLAPEALTM